jgi:hypothetical protein
MNFRRIGGLFGQGSMVRPDLQVPTRPPCGWAIKAAEGRRCKELLGPVGGRR